MYGGCTVLDDFSEMTRQEDMRTSLPVLISTYIDQLRSFADNGACLIKTAKEAGKTKEELMETVDTYVNMISKKMDTILNLLIRNSDIVKAIQAEASDDLSPIAEEDEGGINKTISLLAESFLAKQSPLFYRSLNDDLQEKREEKANEISFYLVKTEICLYIAYFDTLIHNIASALFEGNYLFPKKVNFEPIKGYVQSTRATIRKILKDFLGFVDEPLIPVSASESEPISPEEPIATEDLWAIEEPISSDSKEVLEVQAEESYELTAIQASELTFEMNGFEIFAAEVNEEESMSPFTGILCPIEQVSESAPAVGPGVPLYLPLDVAQEAVAYINASKGFKLDAAPSLSGHSEAKDVGLMTKAEIVNNNLVVHGYLIPSKNNELISAIKNLKDRLGMSINASAEGFNSVVNGVNAFVIKKLIPWGANILESSKATWKKTAVLQASEKNDQEKHTNYDVIDYKEDVEQRQNCLGDDSLYEECEEIISASEEKSDELLINNSQEDTLMPDNAEISMWFDKFNSKLDEYFTNTERQNEMFKTDVEHRQAKAEEIIQAQAKTIEALNAQLAVISQEREQIQAEETKKAQELQAQASQNQLMETLTQKISEQIAVALNPTGQPARKTTPLIQASAGQEVAPLSETQKLFIAAEARLKVMEEQGITGPDRLALIEEKNELQNRLANYY